jgi:osmotically-inducible protein OsmY
MDIRSLLSPILAVALVVTSATGLVAAQKAPLSAEQIKAMVERKIADEDDLGTDIKVSVEGRTVTLQGSVPSLWAKEKAVEETREVPDVEFVVSDLTIPAVESNEALRAEVAKKVRRYVFYTIFDSIDIGVTDGVVTLSGKVKEPYRATEIARLVSRVKGVREVANNIETLPVSIFDDQIRAVLSSRIYNDTVLSKYAFQVDPPIHIIVENGRVTLTGVVNSELERRVAENIARQTFGVFSVENKLKLDREVSSNLTTRR